MNFKPTFLYIKRHSETNKLYFGKTIKNPEKYLGSGSYWQNHIKKHGKDKVETLWFCLFLDFETLQNFALQFSKINNVDTSPLWANQIMETGLEGGSLPGRGNGAFGKTTSLKGRKLSEEHIKKVIEGRLKTFKLIGHGPKLSEEHKNKISKTLTGRKLTKEQCEKISKRLSGKTHSEETKLKMSLSGSGENNSMFGKTHSKETLQKWKDNQRNIGPKNGMFGKIGENNPRYGKEQTEKQKLQNEKTRERLTGKPQTLSKCPHCNKEGGSMVMNRWHFNNCKSKNGN